MTPSDYYQTQVDLGIIFRDPLQVDAMAQLDRVHYALIAERDHRTGFLAYFRKPVTVDGIYLWGGVGIGKTFMMDCFFHTLPFEQKLRLHFHQFMHRVHQELRKHQGEKDPLQAIASELAKEAIVLCFDEFYVSDITDAMLLGRLFKALFLQGVCLVATSNTEPDALYKNGLQRSQFLPAIALLKSHLHILHMPTSTDYRLRHLKEAGVFYTPLNEDTQQKMESSFDTLTAAKTVQYMPITINNRSIQIKKQADDIIWFAFNDICCVPRSQNDYLVIAEKYRIVFISDVPAISASETNTICLFITLVDVLYDARVKLVVSAAEPVEQLYQQGYMIMEYARTHSRLLEMQSADYFSGDFN